MSFDDRRYGYEDGPRGGGRAGEIAGRILRALNWSFPIGTYVNTRVRVHITFVLLLVFRILEAMASAGSQGIGVGESVMLTLRWTGVLFVSVLLHEFGHILACRRVGGQADEILMWPLGGLAMCAPPRRKWAEFVTVVWGPLVNVILIAISYTALAVMLGTPWPLPSMNPATAWSIAANYHGVIGLLYDFFNTNYILLLFNLLLVFYPFDGGRLVQIALWIKLGYERSMMAATTVGMVGAVIVALYGLAIGSSMLLLIAAFGFYACYQQRQVLRDEAYMAGESWKQGVVSYGEYDVQEKKVGYFARRKAERHRQRVLRDTRRRADLDKEIDRILAKVSAHGLQSLTHHEKRTLNRATQEQRKE